MGLEDRLYPLLRVYEGAPQWLKDWVGGAYRMLPEAWRLGKNYPRFVEEARASEGWTKEQISQYQLVQLRESVSAAWKCPFYREHFQKFSVCEKPLESVEELADYPTVDKQHVILAGSGMRNPEFSEKQTLRITTGGSSGQPVPFYLERGVSRPKEQAYLEAMWRRVGFQPGNRLAVLRGHVRGSGGSKKVAWRDASRNWLLLSSYHLTDERIPEYLSELELFAADFFHVYPSSAVRLASYMELHEISLNWRPQALFCGSERLTGWQRRLLERVFGARVYAWYGHSERIVLAGEGYGSELFYFWPGYGFAELGEPDGDGLCEVIGTSFHNHAMPFIRYRTGDYVRVQSLGCEFEWQAVSEISGREMEFLVSADERRVSLTALNRHDDLYDGIRAVQFAQGGGGRVELRFVRGIGKVDEERIRSVLGETLGAGFDLVLKEVSEVERGVNGKQRWLVSG